LTVDFYINCIFCIPTYVSIFQSSIESCQNMYVSAPSGGKVKMKGLLGSLLRYFGYGTVRCQQG